MSDDSVEVVRKAWEAWERGDMQAVFDFYDPAIEWDMSESEVPDMGVYRGHEGVRKFFREWMAPFHDYYAHAEDFTLGSEGVLVRMRQGGRGKESGVDVEMPPLWQLYRLRAGRAVRVEIYRDEHRALEAVGLSEWENAEQRGLAEAGFGALNSGDLEAFLALTAEDVEFTSMVAEAEATTFRGHDGVRAWWETIRGAFEDIHWELLDVRGSGDRGVMHFRMTGTLGRVPVEQAMWQAVVLRNSKAIWWAFFRTERDALEAVGLRE